MNLGNSIGGLSLMLLAVVWLAVFVPQWARRAEDHADFESSAARDREASLSRAVNPIDAQLIRLTHTRNRMGGLAVAGTFASMALVFFTSGTWLAALVWVAAVVTGLAGLLALAAARRITVLALQNNANRTVRLSNSSKLPPLSQRAAPLPRRDWQPSVMPQPIRQRPVGEVAVRGAKVVPIVDVTARPKAAPIAEPKVAREFDSAQIDEILRRRRAN